MRFTDIVRQYIDDCRQRPDAASHLERPELMNQIDLKGRVAVITGGAQGIGYAAAERMLNSGATRGAVGHRRRQAGRGRERRWPRSGTVDSATVELTDEASVAQAAAATLARHGRIDILVNNAGITGGNGTTWELDPAIWRRVIEVNLIGPVPDLPRRGAAHDRARLRPHRQHRLGGRQGRQPERLALQRVEGRR